MNLYTEEVSKLIYQAKDRLPADFPLVTDDREYYIVIEIKREHFDWRTVEDRLEIALVLDRLCNLIKETGIGCVIERI